MDALIISARPSLWEGFEPLFQAKGLRLIFEENLALGLEHLRNQPPALFILDPSGADFDREAMRRALTSALMVNAMVHSVVLSPLSEEELHEALEGLGVLAFLPVDPGVDDLNQMFAALDKVRMD